MEGGGTYSFDGAEAWLLKTAEDELPALSVARTATQALISVLQRAEVKPVEEPAPPRYYQSAALLVLATLGLRSARAALLVIGAGYEPEGHGLKRRLSEAHAHAQAVAADGSGQYARGFLEGRGGKPRRIMGKFGSRQLFDLYSVSEHADARGVRWWLTV